MNATRRKPSNVIALTPSRRVSANKAPQRFKIQEFANPRTGSVSFRVTGSKRDGARVRENFAEEEAARCRQIELETEYLRGHAETTIRATKLSAEQLQLAEVAFVKLGDDWKRLLDAVDCWRKDGSKVADVESPRIDDAVKEFKHWLDGEPIGRKGRVLRDESRKNLRVRVPQFANSIGNVRLNEITSETVESYLGKLHVGAVTKGNHKRAISRFFSYAMQKPRRWVTANPCLGIQTAKAQDSAPVILSVEQCERLLRAAEPAGLAPYVAVCLFAGLRPFEASRITWEKINLSDREIRLEGNQTKTGRPRVVSIAPTLLAWLKACKGQPIFPSNWRKRFAAVKNSAGIKTWPVDVMRHTACSHFFRESGSYGLTAEQFGNSEAIIKAHYQGRVSSADTKKFYAILPEPKRAK